MKSPKKFNYGSVEVEEGALSAVNIKIRVTAMIDGDVLKELKHRASRDKIKYQTLLNKLLRFFPIN